MKAKLAYPRSLSSHIMQINKFFPCLLLTGARQVGKTTLLKSLMPRGMKYVTLDDYALAEQARQDPLGFLNEHGQPLFIDEVQYAPQLFRAIKIKVDENRRNGMYWLSGSQRYRLMKNLSESLAGRVGILELYTFSQREMTRRTSSDADFQPDNLRALAETAATCDIHELYRRIWKGGYPAFYEQPELDRNAFFQSYLQTYIERDVQELSQVGNKSAFVKMMRSAASRTGQQLVYSDIARDADVSPNTAKQWLSILETSGIITMLEPYYINTGKRLTKTPKLYFMDTGLCSWLAGWHTPEMLEDSLFSGAILETWVFGQLYRNIGNGHALLDELSYYREARGAEVDFLAQLGPNLLPMEVKRSQTPRLSDLKIVDRIPTHKHVTRLPGVLFCTAQEFIPMAFGNTAFPISGI